jgi:hypothetical protein
VNQQPPVHQLAVLSIGWAAFLHLVPDLVLPARVNQQPPMHQLAVLSTGWATFFQSAPDGVHHSPFLFTADHCTFFFFLGSWLFSPRPNLTYSYPAHFPTLIHIAPTSVSYFLFPTDIATLKTSYLIDLATVLTTYPTNLVTLLITYLTNLIIVLNLVTLIR